ncbi:hypothetical protein H6P81_001206 [Aristolochia fimbriata]|uniref:Uncharacterized protein n=1 Tax=Aristolochia fimbriata TaxID=158543 RepID=A0AAV7F6J1_ARIFI|nr:hypothetical protein H6P81_001206 [Aristolochia fimbriata]
MAASSPFLLLVLLCYLCFLPSVVYGQSYRNVSLTSSLTAGDKDSSPSSWASPPKLQEQELETIDPTSIFP